MKFWMIIKSAIASLVANRMRSVLAMLGIIMGVGAVISMMAIGAGAQKQMMDNIAKMGVNLLVIRPTQRGTGGVMSGTQQNLTVADADAIISQVPHVVMVAPVVTGTSQLKYLNHNSRVSTVGTAGSYLPVRNFQIDQGRCFTDAECDNLAHVVILGPKTVEDLLGDEEPLGKYIKLDGTNFRVIGVLKPKGPQFWFNPDDQAIIPYTTAMMEVYGLTYLQQIVIQADSLANLDQVQDAVITILRRRHRLMDETPNDFTVENQAEIIAMNSTFVTTFRVLLGSIAAISLLVGGIGIMNIMLVTVTERTREIGVRKAIGARNSDILRQFLFEAMLMSGSGGLMGAVLGVGAAMLIAHFTAFFTVVQVSSIVLSVCVAAGVGIFFGFYPAQRAAQLDPIEALRYE